MTLTPAHKKRLPLIVAAVAALALVIGGVVWWQGKQRWEATDNAFVQAVLRGMDPAKRTRYQGDMDALSTVIASVFVGFLPPSVRKPGMFEDPKVEDALLGAIPGLATTAGLARTGEVYPEYDLLAALPSAVDVFATMRRLRLSYARFQAHLEGEMRSQAVPGVPRLSDAPPVALALAAALFRRSRPRASSASSRPSPAWWRPGKRRPAWESGGGAAVDAARHP